ncbi:MAG TPA: alpha/beta hydrolase [Pyrinomonadaceae bacterium]|nr:alpha/beta hydrolase [Pyrinomonadaceae bacterium]
MNLSEWRTGGEFFDYKGFPIFYRRAESRNETLLLLHGFPTASRDYHKIWSRLAERFSLIAFDMIGYGFSVKPANFDYTTFNQVDVLQSLISHLKIEKLHVLAHDYGNTITLELLARAAEKRLNFSIETICFLNGALFPETNRPVFAQKLLLSPLGFAFGRLISDRFFKKSLASIFGENTQPTTEELNEFLQLFKYNDGQRIAHKLVRYMTERETNRARWTGALETMTQPFRFINGSDDRVSGAHLVRRFREVVPHQKDIIELPGVGHFPHFEVPEKTLKYFFEFHGKSP